MFFANSMFFHMFLLLLILPHVLDMSYCNEWSGRNQRVKYPLWLKQWHVQPITAKPNPASFFLGSICSMCYKHLISKPFFAHPGKCLIAQIMDDKALLSGYRNHPFFALGKSLAVLS